MIYAPVLITTVNRYQHFKECLKSLSRCTWADKTDVYVAVDYPGRREHWKGYIKIKNYLENCGDLGFRSLNVIYRKENYYYSGKGNLKTLVSDISKEHDCYIISEDDNVFSPNFLVYINRGLERYKEDFSVLAICGYRHFYPISFKDNTFFRQSVVFSAWGYGMWSNRRNQYLNIDYKYFRKRLFSKSFLSTVNAGYRRSCQFLQFCSSQWNGAKTDNFLSVYMAINKMDVVMPCISLVQNKGIDETGMTNYMIKPECVRKKFASQSVSDQNDFTYQGTGFEYYKENCLSLIRNDIDKVSFTKFFIAIIKFVCKEILHFFLKY